MKNSKVLDFTKAKKEKERQVELEFKQFREEMDFVDPELKGIFDDIEQNIDHSMLQFEKAIDHSKKQFEIAEMVMTVKNIPITFAKHHQ